MNGELAAQTIDIGGKLGAQKATAEEKVSVGGLIETVDGVYATHVEIGKRGEVKGLVKAKEALISRGAKVEDVHASIITLERGAKARNLYGERIRLEPNCHVYGEVQYTESFETERGSSLAKAPLKVDKLP